MPTDGAFVFGHDEVTSAHTNVSTTSGEIGEGHGGSLGLGRSNGVVGSAVCPMFGRLFSAQIAGESSRSARVWSPRD